LSFYDIAAKKIRQRFFIKKEFLSKLRIFEPKFVLQQKDEENESIIEDVLFVAKRFGGFDEEMLGKEWQFFNLDFALKQKAKIINLHFDDAWKTIMATKDTNGKFKYSMISKLVNAIRSLPNSNADAERVFSMLTDVKTKKRNKLNPKRIQIKSVGERTNSLTMKVDARHLVLMSENLHETNAINGACFLRLFAADECPSTSSDLCN